jgi:hypothetical protein
MFFYAEWAIQVYWHLTMTRQAMYVKHNHKVCLFNHCCKGRVVSITYSECMSVALIIQHAMCTHCNVIGGLPSCTEFFHSI